MFARATVWAPARPPHDATTASSQSAWSASRSRDRSGHTRPPGEGGAPAGPTSAARLHAFLHAACRTTGNGYGPLAQLRTPEGDTSTPQASLAGLRRVMSPRRGPVNTSSASLAAGPGAFERSARCRGARVRT